MSTTADDEGPRKRNRRPAPDPVAALDGIDLKKLHRLRADTTIWTLSDVQTALHMADRSVALKPWRTTCNYLYGGHREWPPEGNVLKRRLPDAGPPVQQMWWPPYYALLPPPDLPGGRAQPRWYAGTILVWAMRTGRLTLTDLTPIRQTPRGGLMPEPADVDVSDIDLDQLKALVDDDSLWTVNDIEQFFQVTHEVAQRWARAVRNRLERGVTTWPPSYEEMKQITRDTTGSGLTWWPSHHRLLPPPKGTKRGDKVRTYGTGKSRWTWEGPYVWRAGDVKKWGLKVGRLLFDGTVVHLHGR